MTKVVNTDKARQGRRGTQVLYVLVAALILACGAWAIAEFYGDSIDPAETGEVSVPDQPADTQ